jgi:hypothetical protein
MSAANHFKSSVLRLESSETMAQPLRKRKYTRKNSAKRTSKKHNDGRVYGRAYSALNIVSNNSLNVPAVLGPFDDDPDERLREKVTYVGANSIRKRDTRHAIDNHYSQASCPHFVDRDPTNSQRWVKVS